MRKIFLGHTSYQEVVYDVAKHSIERRASDAVQVNKIDQESLRTLGIYTRDKDVNGSTEFSITRFLTPYLAGYKGWVLFADNDILCLDDIENLFELADDKYAVMCVKHKHEAREGLKLDGQKQYQYPRKCWSSVVLYNAEHPSNKILTPDLINHVSPMYLHRFMWLQDNEIGELPIEWNWLEGEYPKAHSDVKLIHYTLGGPFFKEYKDTDTSSLWLEEYKHMKGHDFEEKDFIQ